ncbi:MAG: DUF2267 domain-containing protein [Prolixibacteraceae bacterium]
MALNFSKYAQEGNAFVGKLADRLGHPEETNRTGNILRAVLHTLRDRLTVSESLHLLSQLPMFLKAVYVENWKYQETPSQINTVEEFKTEVKKQQAQYGESEFNWEKHTDEIISIVLEELGTYITEGEASHVMAQLPKELEEYFRASISH